MPNLIRDIKKILELHKH